jgi:phosphoserine phosphatase
MKARLIVTDMDGSAVQYPYGDFASSWDALTEILSKDEKEKWFSFVEKYYGKEDYQSWFNAQVDLLKGKRLCDAENFLFPIPYSPGFKEFFSHSNGAKKAILSAGIDIVARKIAQDLNFDFWIAQSLGIENGFFTGTGKGIVDYRNKTNLLTEISKNFNIPLSDSCYIGDTPGDIGCLELVGFPIAFNPHHGLEDYANSKGIPKISDFRELNGILGNGN